MKIKYLFWVLLLITSCSSSEQSIDTGNKLKTTSILNHYLSGNGNITVPRGTRVISSDLDWKNLVSEMNSYQFISPSITEVLESTSIDFSKEMVIAAFDRVLMTSGSRIDMTKVVEFANEIEVTVVKRDTGNISGTALSQPFCILKMDRNSKPIKFVGYSFE